MHVLGVVASIECPNGLVHGLVKHGLLDPIGLAYWTLGLTGLPGR